MPSIETHVWDPGDRPNDEEHTSPNDPERCWEYDGYAASSGYRYWRILEHDWTLVRANSEGSVWMCPRCRKIEERVVAPVT